VKESSFKVHCIISTLLMEFKPEDMTRNTAKFVKTYRSWVKKEYSKDKENFSRLSKEANDAWNMVNVELDKLGRSSLISLPVSFVTLYDILPSERSEHVANKKLFMTVVESHTDYDERSIETESSAVIMGDVIRREIGVKPRVSLNLLERINGKK